MIPGESIRNLEARFLKVTTEIKCLGKELKQKDVFLKLLRGLTTSWVMKVTALQDHCDLRTLSTKKLLSDLKAHEFKISTKEDDKEGRSLALVDNQLSTLNRSSEHFYDFLSEKTI